MNTRSLSAEGLAAAPSSYALAVPADARRRLGMPDEGDAEEKWSAVAGEFFAWLPLRDLPELRREAPYYFEWLAHPPEDPWWDWAELGDRYGQVTPAVLNLSGWYDDAYGLEGAARGVCQGSRTHGALRA